MNKLLPVITISMIIAILSDYFSTSTYDSYGRKIYEIKEKILYFVLIIIMSGFIGLRTSYNDTFTYLSSYKGATGTIEAVKTISLALGDNPGYAFVMQIMKYFHVSPQSYLMLYSLLTNSIYLWFLRKYSKNTWLSVFLFITMGCYIFTGAAIKQCVAIAFCLIATDRFIQKKKLKFVLWVLIASTFHPYSLMYLVVPFLTFEPWSNKTYLLLIIFAIVGFGMQSLMGTVINITTMLGEEYDASTFSGEGINIFRLAVVWVPVIVSFVTRSYLRTSNSKTDNIILNLTILNAEIMFVGLFGTANYFGRLANYFLIFQVLCLPHLFDGFSNQSKKLITILCVVGFIFYFYYENAINSVFDYEFSRITLPEFIKSFF